MANSAHLAFMGAKALTSGPQACVKCFTNGAISPILYVPSANY